MDGKKFFPIVETNDEAFKLAVAARKGRPVRSKAEAIREGKESRFRGTEAIAGEPVPPMSKPVNGTTNDTHTLKVHVSIGAASLQLAKVPRGSLKCVLHLFTTTKLPSHFRKARRAVACNLLQAKVLMKALFAARMARWDLLPSYAESSIEGHQMVEGLRRRFKPFDLLRQFQFGHAHAGFHWRQMSNCRRRLGRGT